MEYIFPIELWQVLFDETDYFSKIRLRQVCKYFHQSLQVPKYDIAIFNDNGTLYDIHMMNDFPFVIKYNVGTLGRVVKDVIPISYF